MTTVDKALSLLDHFSNEQTEIGLSAFARLAGYDKSAVLRMLSALGRAGFVEQDPQSRKYRLGGAFLRFAPPARGNLSAHRSASTLRHAAE